MNEKHQFVAIACGGTGGHLFPGIAVGEELVNRGLKAALLISNKAVDREAVQGIENMEVFSLPSIALQDRNYLSFAWACWKSYRRVKRWFHEHPPAAVLAMGGFTSVPPVLAGKRLGARTFLHEANTIPGRANRWLARRVDRIFLHFPETAEAMAPRDAEVVGMPVRRNFQKMDVGECRRRLGLDPRKPVLLVMGGSQGAHAVNQLMIETVPALRSRLPDLGIVHLTGGEDAASVREVYRRESVSSFVEPFYQNIPVALGAASVAISRAGASSLAELACLEVPSILIPFPHAADNHQWSNALAFQKAGAARVLRQSEATPETLIALISELLEDAQARGEYTAALRQWHRGDAAASVAERICRSIPVSSSAKERRPAIQRDALKSDRILAS